MKERPILFSITTGQPSQRGKRLRSADGLTWIERLQDISEEDAAAEGISDGGCLNCGEPEPCGCADPKPDARDAFARLWHSINGEESWHANPWVWVVEFKRVEGGAA